MRGKREEPLGIQGAGKMNERKEKIEERGRRLGRMRERNEEGRVIRVWSEQRRLIRVRRD